MKLSVFVWACSVGVFYFLPSVIVAVRTLDQIEDSEFEEGYVSATIERPGDRSARIALVQRYVDGTIGVGLNVGDRGKLVNVAPDPANEGKFVVQGSDVTIDNWGSSADFGYDKEALVAYIELLANSEAPKVKPQPTTVKKILVPKKKRPERRRNPFTPTAGDKWRERNNIKRH